MNVKEIKEAGELMRGESFVGIEEKVVQGVLNMFEENTMQVFRA